MREEGRELVEDESEEQEEEEEAMDCLEEVVLSWLLRACLWSSINESCWMTTACRQGQTVNVK